MPFPALAYVAGAWLVTGNLKHFPAAVRDGRRAYPDRVFDQASKRADSYPLNSDVAIGQTSVNPKAHG